MGLEQSGVQLIAQGASVYISDLKSATSATNGFVDTTEKGSGKVSAAGQVMIGALRQVGTIAVDVFAAAAKATASFVKDSIDVAGDFESNFNRFKIAAGKGVDTAGLERFKSLFIQLGRELPVSTNEVEKAATEMVSGGIDPAIVAGGALRQTLQFAAASGLSLADAASTSAKFLAGWTDSAATTEQKVAFLTESTDALTKAAAASSTTAGELRLGLFNVQGAAQALHAPFDDVVATLGLLAPAFESSAQAGTALNVFMTRLVPSTNPATDAMKALGIITAKNQNLFFDAKGGFLGMANAAEVLKEHMGSLTDEQKISTLHTLFGNDAMKVGNLLLQDGAKGLNDFIAKMQQQAGVQEAAKTAQEGYAVAVKNAQGSVEALQITLGTRLLPVLTEVLNDHIAPAINTLTTFADKILGASDPVLAFASAIHQWDAPLGSIVFYLTELARGGEGVSAWLKETPPLFQGLVGGIQSAIAEFSKLSSAFDTGGISGLIDQLLSDIGSALPGIESKLGEWGQSFIDWVEPYIPPMLDALGAAVDDALAWVKGQAPQWLKQLGVWGEQLGEWVAPYIPIALKALDGLVSDAWDWVKGQAPGWGKQLLVWGSELVDWIEPMIPPAIAELGKMGTRFLDWVGGQAQPLLQKFFTWKDAFVAWIPGATVTFLAEWPKMFDKFLDWIGTEAGPLLKKLGDWALSFVEWIAPMIPPFLVALGGVALAIGAWIIETAAVLSKKIVEKWLPAMLGWIVTDAVPGLGKALNSFLEVFQGWVNDAERDLARWMIGVGTSIVDGIRQGIDDAWSGFLSWVHSKIMELPQAVRDFLGISSPSTEFMPIGEFSVLGIMQGFSDTWPQLTNLVSTLTDDLIKQAADIGKQVQGVIADSFGSTASIDRQKSKNLDNIAKLDPKWQAGVQQQINEAEKISLAMNDPQQAAAYFRMRSDQLIELANIQDKLSKDLSGTERAQLDDQLRGWQDGIAQINAMEKAGTLSAEAADAARLHTAQRMAEIQDKIAGDLTDQQHAQLVGQYQLINAAQNAETGQLRTNQASQGSALQDLIDKINGLLLAHTKDANGKNVSLPGIIQNSTVATLSSFLDQLMQLSGQSSPPAHLAGGGLAKQGTPFWVGEQGPEIFWPNMTGTVTPAATSAQMARQANTATYNGQVGNTFHMPIYTNNTPGAIQQSWAVMQASMP
jgi:TP901 family phage tail tape measure protein